jgi:hypothetical protein
MNEARDSLYNTGDAIALSLQLTGAAPTTSHGDENRYIRFSAGPRAAPALPRQSLKAEEEPHGEPDHALPAEPAANGEEMLKWCISTAAATTGFIIDTQGFVILKEGENIPDDAYEGAAANLGLVVNQLNQMEIDKGDVQVADLIYKDGFMLIICVKDKDGDTYNMGIIGDSPITTGKKKLIYQQVRRSLMQIAL